MNLVARLRRSAGLTQAALAELAGTSQPTIAAYETGTKRPNLRTLQRLASAVGLGVPCVIRSAPDAGRPPEPGPA